jgi:ketosteroid isomerase-like protein
MIDIMSGTDSDVNSNTKRGSKAGAVVALCLVALAAAGGAYWVKSHNKPVVVVTAEESAAAVKAADIKWSKAAQAHDMVTLDSYYADDATVLPANEEMITNKGGATKYWMDHLTPNVEVSWSPMYVEAAKGGDMVYVLGSYTMTTKPVKGKGATVTDHGKYLSVWKKQADGSWKAEADTWNSDKPLPGTKTAG